MRGDNKLFLIVGLENNCSLNKICCTERVVYCVKVRTDSICAKNTLVAMRSSLSRGGITIPHLLEFQNGSSLRS